MNAQGVVDVHWTKEVMKAGPWCLQGVPFPKM